MNIKDLRPGDHHYKAYVGPPTQFDFMGATQFRLLCSLGLRAHHHVLDFGCGSLRAGRLLIQYLNKSCYYGIEPNKWLVNGAIEHELGKELISLKQPRFSHNSDFETSVFSKRFDFILAQSVFSHSGKDLIATALNNFRNSLKADGLIAATFIESSEDSEEKGWIYPKCVGYRKLTINELIEGAGLHPQRIPWFHPRQTWYLMFKEEQQMLDKEELLSLTGIVLRDEELKEREVSG